MLGSPPVPCTIVGSRNVVGLGAAALFIDPVACDGCITVVLWVLDPPNEPAFPCGVVRCGGSAVLALEVVDCAAFCVSCIGWDSGAVCPLDSAGKRDCVNWGAFSFGSSADENDPLV